MSLTTRSMSLTTGPQISLNETVEIWGCWVSIRTGVTVSGNQSLGQGHGSTWGLHIRSLCLGAEAGKHPLGGQRLMGAALLRPATWVVRSRWLAGIIEEFRR